MDRRCEATPNCQDEGTPTLVRWTYPDGRSITVDGLLACPRHTVELKVAAQSAGGLRIWIGAAESAERLLPSIFSKA